MTETIFAVGPTSAFPENSMTPVDINGESVLIIHQKGEFYAMKNECTHQAYPLSDGRLLDGAVKCDWHGATFNLKTGKATMPAVKKIRLYQVIVDGEDVKVSLQEN